jgi:hypothetical protein
MVEAVTHPLCVVLQPEGISPMVDFERQASGTALFLVASLSNHTCVDPAMMPWFMDSLHNTPFVALRDVAAGEELTMDYASSVSDVRDKRIRNFVTHGFVCQCPNCAGPLLLQ